VLLATAFVLGCGDGSKPASTEPQAHLFPGGHGNGILDGLNLLSCTPQAYDSSVQAIGTAGGSITVSGYTLTIPSGALDSTVNISAVAPVGAVNHVVFEPSGLQFNQPVYLTMSYSNCDLLGLLLPKHIVYTSPALDILSILPSFDNLFTKRVTGR